MANPNPYVPSYSFSDWQAANPAKPLPAPQVDNELANIASSLNFTISSLADVRRSDGKLKNGIVTVDSLSPGLTLGFTLKGAWTVGAHYVIGEGVFYAGKCYRCQVVNDATNLNRPDIDTTTWLFLYSTTDLAGAMSIATYDPTGIGANVFARANHTGTQAQSTIVNLVSDLAAKADAAAMASALATKVDKATASFGQCRLALSGGNLVLSRYNGQWLMINGAMQSIPAGGVSLAAAGLTPGTLYYIYAFMNSGTMTLEASATTHATDATYGTEVKSGDATCTLVGMARPISGPAWVDTAAQRFVRSWFNRRSVGGHKAFTANRTTTSSTLTEINPEIRCEWLQWADEVPTAAIQGATANNTANFPALTSIGWDGVSDPDTFHANASATGLFYNCSTTSSKDGLSEGYHYATVMGSAPSGGTATWAAGTGIVGSFTSLNVRI